MKKHTEHPKQISRRLDANPKALKQSSISEILQRSRNHKGQQHIGCGNTYVSNVIQCDMIDNIWTGLRIAAKIGTGIVAPLIKSSVPGAALASGLIDIINSGVNTVKEASKKKVFFKNSEVTIKNCSGSIEKYACPCTDILAGGNTVNGACAASIDIPKDESVELKGGLIDKEKTVEKIDRITDPLATFAGGAFGVGGASAEIHNKKDSSYRVPDYAPVTSSMEYVTGNIGASIDNIRSLIKTITS